jgi:hypothetical protein
MSTTEETLSFTTSSPSEHPAAPAEGSQSMSVFNTVERPLDKGLVPRPAPWELALIAGIKVAVAPVDGAS